jgi:hypothetical protein
VFQTDRPTICPKCMRQWREHAIDIDSRDNLKTLCPGQPPDDPRPDDPAELARQVAIELRKRGIWAHKDDELPYVKTPFPMLVMFREYPYSIHASEFDNLGPIAIADAIQALEAKRAQEWAGDK